MRKPNGFWNLQNLIDSAKQFDSVSAWSKAAMGAYLAARRKGLIDQVTKHMLSHGESISRARTVWTREACLRSAKRFMKRRDWDLGDHDAYQAARRHGWYVECTSHMARVKQINGYWNRESCLSEARKHSHISEWLAANPSSYQSAKSNPEWFAACTVHMERLWSKKWAKPAILNDAKKYSTIQEWSRNSTGAYQACWAKGLMPQATAHMIKNPKWFPVATIHQILQSHDLEYVAEKTFEDPTRSLDLRSATRGADTR